MAEREEELARASEGLRARRSPPPGAEARVLAGLETMLGPLGGGGGLVASTSPASQAIWWAKVVGTTLGLTSAGLLALRAVVVVAGLDTTPPPSERAPRIEPRVEASPHTTDAPAPAPGSSDRAAPALGVDAPASAPTSASTRAPELPPSLDASGPLDADALAGELALMRSIRSETDALARLELLAEHERVYPRGHMADERRALQAIAACELGRVAEAREGLERLRETRPSSPLLDRVVAACPGL